MEYLLIDRNIAALFGGIVLMLLLAIAIAVCNWLGEAKKNTRLNKINAILREKLAVAEHEAYRLNYELPEVDDDEIISNCEEVKNQETDCHSQQIGFTMTGIGAGKNV